MKRLIKIMLFPILSIVLMTSGTIGSNIKSELHSGSSFAISDDSTNLIRLIVVDSFRLRIIPPSSGIQFYRSGIVFLSKSKNERKMSPKHISFGTVEAYYAAVEDSVPGRHMIFSPYSSFSYPCEAMTFSHDFSTIYYTKFPRKEVKEKIFMAKITLNGKSQRGLVNEIAPLDFCSDNSNYSHPTLSSDDSTMIFASDKAGSLGGMDLFITRKTGEKWSVPENLGKSINTPGNEFFPFLDSENNLFFSSDGLPGYGGYDVFTCKFNGVSWDKPVNLSDRVNSDRDDIAFTINKIDGKTAFFTRRQKSGYGNTQLFRVTLMRDIANQNLLTISYVFNGKPIVKTSLLAVTTDTGIKPVKEAAKPETEVVKRTKSKVTDTTLNIKKLPKKVSVSKPVTGGKLPEAKVVIIKPTLPTPVAQKDVVIYRIQFISSNRPKNEKEIILNGKTYSLYEYFYLGAYRYTVGEFKTLPPAVELQRICRQSGYPQAFVGAFKNNTRSLDLKLFK